jgi:hypothetical protein
MALDSSPVRELYSTPTPVGEAAARKEPVPVKSKPLINKKIKLFIAYTLFIVALACASAMVQLLAG